MQIHTHACTYIYIYILSHILAHPHACTWTHVHTYTHSFSFTFSLSPKILKTFYTKRKWLPLLKKFDTTIWKWKNSLNFNGRNLEDPAPGDPPMLNWMSLCLPRCAYLLWTCWCAKNQNCLRTCPRRKMRLWWWKKRVRFCTENSRCTGGWVGKGRKRKLQALRVSVNLGKDRCLGTLRASQSSCASRVLLKD